MVAISCFETVFGGLESIWNTGTFSDVEVLVGHESYFAHKVILSAHSPMLQAMFTSDMKESKMCQVRLDSICRSSLAELLHFMYKGVIELNNYNVRDVMYVADQLLMRKLVELCADYMLQHLEITNCIDVMRVADAHSCENLRVAALSFICQNFSQVSKEISFLQLELCEVISLLNTKELPFSDETDILGAAMEWLSYDIGNRKHHAFRLLSVVRFRSITIKDLDNVLARMNCTNDVTFNVIIMSIKRDLFTGKLFRNPNFCKPKRQSNSILIFGGAVLGRHGVIDSTNSLYHYNTINNTWKKLESFSFSRYKHGMGVIGDRVYLVGGQSECYSITSSVECYCITTGLWKTLCSTIDFRINPMVTVVNGRMFVSSVDDGNELPFSLIEVYDSISNIWSPYKSNIGWKPMNTGVTARYKDKLYELVVEGTLSNLRVTPLFLDSDIYNRLDIGVFGDVYYPHPPLPCVRYNCTMVVMADRIYIIGGSSSPLLVDYTYRSKGSKTVYCLNFSKNKWEVVSPLIASRCGHTAKVVGKKIYVFGGQNPDLEPTRHLMEVYDTDTDTWQSLAQPCNFMFSSSCAY